MQHNIFDLRKNLEQLTALKLKLDAKREEVWNRAKSSTQQLLHAEEGVILGTCSPEKAEGAKAAADRERDEYLRAKISAERCRKEISALGVEVSELEASGGEKIAYREEIDRLMGELIDKVAYVAAARETYKQEFRTAIDLTNQLKALTQAFLRKYPDEEHDEDEEDDELRQDFRQLWGIRFPFESVGVKALDEQLDEMAILEELAVEFGWTRSPVIAEELEYES